MALTELTTEQRRQITDATHVFEAWRVADRAFRHAYKGSMHWRKSKGHEYLGRKYGQVWESMGVRSAETEMIKANYTEARIRFRHRLSRLSARIETMAKVNRALRLGRLPTTPAKILRRLDELGLLGKQLVVVGTNALYAYEARSGVLFDGDLTSTSDIDLLVDTRQKMSLAIAAEVRPTGIIGLLRRIDRSFERTAEFRATNDQGYFVDLIAPMRPNEVTAPLIRLGETNDDLAAATIMGLHWLMNAPRFNATVIAEDGMPVWMSCIDPRAFALHKWWVSQRPDREAIKRRRDEEQAVVVSAVAIGYLNLPFDAKALTALPLDMIRGATDLVARLSKWERDEKVIARPTDGPGSNEPKRPRRPQQKP